MPARSQPTARQFALGEDVTEERWRWVSALNVASVSFGMQACIRVMKEKSDIIINTSSIAGLIGQPSLAAYCGTKEGDPFRNRLIGHGSGFLEDQNLPG